MYRNINNRGNSIIVPSLKYLDFMQFNQKVGQYHLTGTDIVITKSAIFYGSLAVQTPWGAKQSSINYVLPNA